MHIKAYAKGYPLATSFWLLLFLLAVVGLNSLVLAERGDVFFHARSGDRGVVGAGSEAGQAAALLVGGLTSDSREALLGDQFLTLVDGTVIGLISPLNNPAPDQDGLKSYKIRKGDTLQSVADQFNISLDTVKWANPGLKSQLRVGQEIAILPVSGILYNVQSGDTLESVADLYEINADLIKQYNADYQKTFSDGNGAIILPFAKPLANDKSVPKANALPDLKNYFSLPAVGWNWGVLDEDNAVDIANQCGTPVTAAAEGLVVPDEVYGDGTSGWNGGYGLFVLIDHSNGTRTRYASLQKTLVKTGDLVAQGQTIGLMGDTGSVNGPTGCRLHFQVIGAKNPFATK